MWFLSLLACSTQEKPVEAILDATEPHQDPAAVAPTQADPTAPPADQVLQRFVDASNQCKVLTAQTYRFVWQSIVTDQKTLAIQEKVMHQGRQGTSFTKLHEQTRPTWGLTAIGRTPDGDYWSGTNQGIQKKIVDEGLQRQMMQNLDPTPICAFEKRWTERVNLGSATYQDKDSWHLQLTWADGTQSEAWFDKDEGMLRGMVTRRDGYELHQDMAEYTNVNGILWPSEEKGREVRDGNMLILARKLVSIQVDQKIPDIGPEELSKMLAQKVAEGQLQKLDGSGGGG